ncbi:Uncharacterized protein Fot_22469 [Forsythia ovata]|uniref:BZIP domain-containing protein n=1 Tax=Forsythia ovata TaxID=205694 RepID=A0ABD1UYT5_9LAMI
MEDWFNAPLEEVEIQTDNQRTAKKKGKLTPKRGSTSASHQADQPESMLQFMPTPGLSMRPVEINMRSGQSTSSPVAEGISNPQTEATVIRTEEVDISPMVDELEQLNSEEATRTRAERARARRQRNRNAIQSVYKTRSRTNA